jgi:hypothetical protein
LLGVGMACAVTALPILILLMEKLDTMLTVPVMAPRLKTIH